MAFRPTRSLARSTPKDVKEGAASTSEMDTQAGVSDSGSEVTGVTEQIRRKAIVNRAGPENNEEEDDNIVIKLSEWRAMTEIIGEVFLEIHGLPDRLYLMAKKDANIRKRREATKDKADKLNAMLNEVRSKKGARTIRTTTAPIKKKRRKARGRRYRPSIRRTITKGGGWRIGKFPTPKFVPSRVRRKQKSTTRTVTVEKIGPSSEGRRKEEGTIQKWIEVPKRTRHLRPSLRRWRG